jgi:outer membrane receptor for ferrienterochelin and colicins
MFNHRGWLRWGPAPVVLLCVSAAAQEPSAPAEPARQEMILFQDVPSVFGASKYEQDPAEAPASVTVVTADEIERFGYRTLSEILRSVRGLYVNDDRNYNYVGVRGFGRPGDYNTRVLLLLDGHRTNDNIYDQAAIGTDAYLDVDLIDRVEIIRGPGSSLYGTSAFLGVINVVTKPGRALKGGELSARLASHDTAKAGVTYGTRTDGGFEWLVSGSYYRSDGERIYFPEFDAPETNGGWAEGVDGDEYRSAFAKLSRGDLSLEAAYASREKVVPTASFETVFNDPRNRTTDERVFLALKHDREIGQRSRVITTLSYDSYAYDGTYVYTDGLQQDTGRGAWWTAESQYVGSLGDKNKLTAGAEWRENTRQDQELHDVDPYESVLDVRGSGSIFALYAQDEYRPRENWIADVGVRYDRYDTFGGTTNPRLALIGRFRDRTTLKLLYGRAFRAPNPYEMFYDDNGVSQKGNPSLEPETISTYEAEIEHRFRGGARGLVSLYSYGVSNLITQETDPADDLAVFRNLERVKGQGVEAEIRAGFGEAVEGRLSGAYQTSRDDATDELLTNSPRTLLSLAFSSPLITRKLLVSIEERYMSRRKVLDGGYAGGFAVTNLNFLLKGAKRLPAVSVGVYNLLDHPYGDPAGEEHVQRVIPQEGRSFRFYLRFAF